MPINNKAIVKERTRGIIIGVLFAVVGTIAIAAMTLFGWQDGLAIGERCHLSWAKVIVFCVGGFIALALQTVGYFIYHHEMFTKYTRLANHQAKQRWKKKKQKSHFVLYTLLFVLVPVLIFAFLLPVIVDQNHNVLWLFDSTMGILCILCVFILSAVCSILQKCAFTQRLN